ncbi:MAG TPA: 16S rRNA (cytosine(1402)-N(4))-methyltransferase RsmH [Actinomycetota bacterium]|nr:16S rRNA (cytosine(1402)-N(4))-methyltransferase RsmH [Actinomycetota bacterium]
MSGVGHEPVMVDEVVRFLGGRPTVVDLTLGAGGHAEALLESGVGRLIGVDRDPEAVTIASGRLSRFGDRFAAVRARFSDVPVENRVDGVLYDLGVSSMQIERPERGFSFRHEGPLDMRMGRGQEDESAMDLVNAASEKELARIIFEYGEERRSRRVAAAIVRARQRRPIETTEELVGIVVSAVGGRRGGPHPARRTFQALRIAVNRELEELATSLPRAVGVLAPGGRVVVIAYHSLEDRIVKRFFAGDERLTVLTKKPLVPSADEAARNPRARSAKLRAAELAAEAA